MKNTCRKAFTDTLLELAKEDSRIVALTSDARGSAALNKFVEELPEQFIEVGIAEQNEVGVAAGASTCGLIPFVCAPAPFLSARSLEQIKVDAAYSNTNVKICGVSGGLSYGALGGSHHAIHDLAAIRPMENITVLVPADARETRWMTQAIARTKGPVYMRMGRNEVEDIYTEEDRKKFRLGKAICLKEGRDLTMIAAGELVCPALTAAKKLEACGISVRVLDMHTIKPLDEEAVQAAAQETKGIVTLEEHSIHGGLGGAVAEYTVQNCPVPMKIMGIPEGHVVAGETCDLFPYYGLDEESIAENTKEFWSTL